ncbi:hypothetical protein ACFSTI_18955 [Rhizorhabdus histidinilytica]
MATIAARRGRGLVGMGAQAGERHAFGQQRRPLGVELHLADPGRSP